MGPPKGKRGLALSPARHKVSLGTLNTCRRLPGPEKPRDSRGGCCPSCPTENLVGAAAAVPEQGMARDTSTTFREAMYGWGESLEGEEPQGQQGDSIQEQQRNLPEPQGHVAKNGL